MRTPKAVDMGRDLYTLPSFNSDDLDGLAESMQYGIPSDMKCARTANGGGLTVSASSFSGHAFSGTFLGIIPCSLTVSLWAVVAAAE